MREKCTNIAEFLGEDALLIPGYEGNSPDAPSDFDGLISGYRLISGYHLIGGPLLYLQSDFDRLISGYRHISGCRLIGGPLPYFDGY